MWLISVDSYESKLYWSTETELIKDGAVHKLSHLLHPDLNTVCWFTSELYYRMRKYVKKTGSGHESLSTFDFLSISLFWCPCQAEADPRTEYKHRITGALKHNQMLQNNQKVVHTVASFSKAGSHFFQPPYTVKSIRRSLCWKTSHNRSFIPSQNLLLPPPVQLQKVHGLQGWMAFCLSISVGSVENVVKGKPTVKLSILLWDI